MDGMLKYGRANWRHSGVRASVYKDALDRHMGAWFEGHNYDPDSGLPHLAHALACLAILVDAHEGGVLEDDRQYRRSAAYGGFVQAMTTNVPRLKQLRKDAPAPKHYTIKDGS